MYVIEATVNIEDAADLDLEFRREFARQEDVENFIWEVVEFPATTSAVFTIVKKGVPE